MSESKNSSSGIGSVCFLGVAFVVLKLCNVIDWSWWWVTLPFYGSLILYAIILALMFGYIEYKDRKDIKNKTNRTINNLKSKSRFQQRLDDYMTQQKYN
ncbi:MAG: hypothetical protein V4608_14885 [Bacteroidota bacterium]